jgi:hypothetical protein
MAHSRGGILHSRSWVGEKLLVAFEERAKLGNEGSPNALFVYINLAAFKLR